MEFEKTGFDGLIKIQFLRFHDSRGYFSEVYQHEKFSQNGINTQFIQLNESFSKSGVIRGLHMQKNPHQQAKLVRVVKGGVRDVVVDVRRDSETFGKSFTTLLSAEQNNALYVPHGFLHGFIALEDTFFQYFVDNYYNAESEAGVRWNDPDLNINWKEGDNVIISEKDKKLPNFSEFIKTLA